MHGCPIGSLCSELDKRDDDVRRHAATVLERLITVAEQQFAQLGRRDATDLAVALVASWEGIASPANTPPQPETDHHRSATARTMDRLDALNAWGIGGHDD
jgi:hypothetical protein